MSEFALSSNVLKRYIPSPYNLYEYRQYFDICNSELVAYYIGEKAMTMSEFKSDTAPTIGYINCVFNYDNNQVEVNFLISNRKGLGIGTLLLLIVVADACDKGLETILLDDDSDNYNQDNNIYLKLGLHYCEDYGPEMEGNVQDIYSKLPEMEEKYQWNRLVLSP